MHERINPALTLVHAKSLVTAIESQSDVGN